MARLSTIALTVAAASTYVAANGAGDCAQENIKCCNQVKDVDDLSEGEASLIDIPELLGQVGLQCDQIPILGVAVQDMCKT